MKKLLAVLLALVIVGGAFAQVTVATYLHGTLNLYDQDGQGALTENDWGDTLTFKGSVDNMGFSLTYANPLKLFTETATDNGSLTPRDYNAWFKFLDGKAKLTFGKLRNGDYRMGNVYNKYTDRITGYGLLVQAYPMDGLSLGVNLPYGTTAADVSDVFGQLDLGAAYTITDIGKVIVLANLDSVADSTKFNFGFNYTGMENLSVVLQYIGTFATATTHFVGIGADYVMDALDVGAEFNLTSAAATTWTAFAYGYYTLSDMTSVGLEASFDNDSVIWALPFAKFAFAKGFVQIGVDVTLDNGTTSYAVPLSYEVSF